MKKKKVRVWFRVQDLWGVRFRASVPLIRQGYPPLPKAFFKLC